MCRLRPADVLDYRSLKPMRLFFESQPEIPINPRTFPGPLSVMTQFQVALVSCWASWSLNRVENACPFTLSFHDVVEYTC
jgi:hypothetical protein